MRIGVSTPASRTARMPEDKLLPSNKRLFLGSMLSKEKAEAVSVFFQNNQKFAADTISWSRTDKLHMTWFFLGNTQMETIPYLVSSLESALVQCTKTSITYTYIDLFPSSSNPRLLALLPESVPLLVHKTARAIKDSLHPLGFADPKNFHPHMTIGRLKNQEMAKKIFSSQNLYLDNLLPMEQQLAEVCLIESKAGNKSSNNYEILHSFVLS